MRPKTEPDLWITELMASSVWKEKISPAVVQGGDIQENGTQGIVIEAGEIIPCGGICGVFTDKEGELLTGFIQVTLNHQFQVGIDMPANMVLRTRSKLLLYLEIQEERETKS